MDVGGNARPGRGQSHRIRIDNCVALIVEQERGINPGDQGLACGNFVLEVLNILLAGRRKPEGIDLRVIRGFSEIGECQNRTETRRLPVASQH